MNQATKAQAQLTRATKHMQAPPHLLAPTDTPSIPKHLQSQHAQHEVCHDVGALALHRLCLEEGVHLSVWLNPQLLLTPPQLINIHCGGWVREGGWQRRRGAFEGDLSKKVLAREELSRCLRQRCRTSRKSNSGKLAWHSGVNTSPGPYTQHARAHQLSFLTLLVSDAQAACRKVKGFAHSELSLVLIHLADVGAGASNLEGVKALPVVRDVAAELQGWKEGRGGWRWEVRAQHSRSLSGW